MSQNTINLQVQRTAMFLLTLLRVSIGWHFLYEGLVKLTDKTWTAKGYLESATGPLAGLFHGIAANEVVLQAVNYINILALILIGAGLMLGLLTKASQISGIVLLFVYYISHPPVFSDPGFFREGSYFLVSKDLIEILALLLLMFFPTGRFLGLDGLLPALSRKPMHKLDSGQPEATERKANEGKLRRREVLKHLATLPFMGGVVYGVLRKSTMESAEEQNLVDAGTSPTQKFVSQIQAGSNKLDLENLKGQVFDEVKEIKGTIPTGMLGDMVTSKMILGGNLLSGYVHSRDLIYVSSLVLQYHQKDRIFRTLMLAEQCGINTLLSNPVVMPLMKEYWDGGYGKIQFITDCAGLIYWPEFKPMDFQEYLDLIQKSIDDGANAGYIQGETADYYIENNGVDKLAKVIDLIKKNNLPVGIGAHKIETIKKCAEYKLETDFWMKTLHSHNYWSAKHPTWHDNMYCFDPEETIAFMETLPQPWIAFKTLAAGSLHPNEAFPYAFKNGADFICAGMYDFQLIEDVNIALNAMEQAKDRSRPWRA